MCKNNLLPKLRNAQRAIKVLRRDIAVYNRRLMQTAVMLSHLKRQEEVLLQKLYPESKVIHISIKHFDVEKTRYKNILRDLQSMSPEDLQNFIDFTTGE